LVKKIFNKKAKEIFFLPILSGLRLSVLVLFFALIFSFFLRQFAFNAIIFFVVNTLIIGLAVGFIGWKKPTILGVYLHDLLVMLFPKLKKRNF
jgi:hypothetical protein